MKSQEMKTVAKIVSNITGVDVKLMRRHRQVVEAKMCFSKILRVRGHTYQSIGKFLGVDHSTIVYHEKTFNKLYNTDKRLTKTYNDCVSIFAEEIGYSLSDSQDDKSDVNMEASENKRLRKILYKYSRLGYIIDLIEKHTPRGSEETMEAFLIEIFKNEPYGRQQQEGRVG